MTLRPQLQPKTPRCDDGLTQIMEAGIQDAYDLLEETALALQAGA